LFEEQKVSQPLVPPREAARGPHEQVARGIARVRRVCKPLMKNLR